MNKKLLFRFLLAFVCITFIAYQLPNIKAIAEQSGSSPESGASSRLKTAYDWLVAKGTNYGATDAPDWTNDWQTYWNRIMESAVWEPDGDALASNVDSDKTFYAGSDNRTIKTGTRVDVDIDYSQQSLVKRDDYYTGDEAGEESSWTNTANNVWKDARTGLYWSNNLGNNTNSFTIASCDFFTTTPRGSYAGADSDCGNAINACGTLSLEAVTSGGAKIDWYLPTQKELQQAYIDGMYNQAGATYTTTSNFWSSTEQYDNPANAWRVYLLHGLTLTVDKTNSLATRCVRRD